MTVKELKEKLNEYDENLEVKGSIWNTDEECYLNIGEKHITIQE